LLLARLKKSGTFLSEVAVKNKTTGIVQVVLVVFSILLFSFNTYANSAADYWPAWRGPGLNGVAGSNANPPIKWSEKENIKWKVAVPGEGLSSPVIWADKIFFLTSILTGTTGSSATAPAASNQRGGGMSQTPAGEYKFDFVCMNRKTGKIIWEKTASQVVPHEGHQESGSFASYSPVTDGKYVWASFGSRGVYCYDMDGNQVWSKDMGKLTTLMGFGEGSSAVLAGNALIVLMDQEGGNSALYALNKQTGEQLWKKDRDEGTSWSTPLPIEVNGKLQVVVSATKLIRSYDAQTGDLIWQCSGQTSNVIPSPVTGFGMVFCTSGYRGNSLQAIELGRTGDLSGTDAVKWQVTSNTPYVPSPLLYGDKIYFLTSNNEVLSCYQAQNGKANYVAQQLVGAKGYYSSPVGAADRVYLASQNGVTLVIKNSDKYEILATNKLDDRFDASPAIAGNELFLKGKKYFYCIAE
jgi:outer membrane protein assembly factor BamB